ncbi:hypothetical protein JOL79_31450 [Microbispora sp. RL4-1S]|uniref:DUF541 domain-containing protein n=1 Tax=Microbispora oryzae TaxID=2806554 RepID=A0A940WS08_9ACTN|nr:hypothetical protein [Microbispora oryzae]MBP2708303.1 hypothetical protein [Microbispora oryzae]
MRLRLPLTFLALYVVAAAPAFLPGDGRVIVQPATNDAVEVYLTPVNLALLRSYEGIEPFNRALEIAQRRAESHSHDLAPPYILHDPYRLVAPYVTERGRALAALPISGAYSADGKSVRFTIASRPRPAENSQAELTALAETPDGPMEQTESSLGMGIDPELNRAVLEVNAFDQDLRRRLARRYGGLITVHWEPFTQRPQLD